MLLGASFTNNNASQMQLLGKSNRNTEVIGDYWGSHWLKLGSSTEDSRDSKQVKTLANKDDWQLTNVEEIYLYTFHEFPYFNLIYDRNVNKADGIE